MALQKAAFNESYMKVKERYLNEMMENEQYQNESEESLNEIADQMA